MSRKKKHITETETRITTAPYREAGVQDANTWLEQHVKQRIFFFFFCAKQRMAHKPPMKLLSPKARVKIGQWNVRTLFETGNPQGKRKRGRPQHTWRCTGMAELEGKHLTWNEAKGTAQNRVRWRAPVEDLCST